MRQKTYVLAKAILERKDILFGTSENVFKPQILKEKEDAWEAVRLEMMEQGFTNFERKSWRDVRNHDWQYLRRSAVAKYEHNQKAGVEPIPYSDVDKIVFEIMGNEVPSSSSQFDLNGAIAASFNFLKNEDQQQMAFDGMDSSFLHAAPTLIIPGTEPSYNTEQQQINSLLNTALAASASMLSRKMSWEANSPAESAESPREIQQQKLQQQRSYSHLQNHQQQLSQQNNEDELQNKDTNGQADPNAELFQSIIASSLPNSAQSLERNEAGPSVSSGIITSSTQPIRKRPHSSSSAAGRSVDDEIQEAKLSLILLQVKREEILVKQERVKLVAEEAKARQEQAKAELLERQLRTTGRSTME